MRLLYVIFGVLVFTAGVGIAEEMINISGDFARDWLDNFLATGGEEPTSQDGGNDLWSWGGAPNGYKIVNGTLEEDLDINITWVDDYLILSPLREPITIDESNVLDDLILSPYYSDDGWVLAQHYERPIIGLKPN